MYLPNFLDGFDRLVAFDAETTGKRTPDAEFVRKQPFAWRAPGIIIEVGFVEMLREGEGWRKGETWSSKVNPDGPIDPEAIKIHRIRPADLRCAEIVDLDLTAMTAASISAIQPMGPD